MTDNTGKGLMIVVQSRWQLWNDGQEQAIFFYSGAGNAHAFVFHNQHTSLAT